MGIYHFVLALIPIAMIASLTRSRGLGLLALTLTAVTALLISGMRWASDVDHIDYSEMFAETPNLTHFNEESIRDLHGEPGYLLVSAIFKSLGMNFVFLSFSCAMLSICAKAFVSNRFTHSAGLVLCLYLCIHFITIEFIQIRWAVASALIILAANYQFQRKQLIAITLLVLAIGIHYFAALFVLVFLLAEIQRERIHSTIVIVTSLAGLALAANELEVPMIIESDLYVIKRTFRYLSDPLSSVGLLSYARLAIFPTIYFFLAWRYPFIATEAKTIYLRRISFASIAVTLLLSFVPLMHFRAVVIADFFSLLLIARMLDRQPDQFSRIVVLTILSTLFSIWYVIDIFNYAAANRLYEYQTWLYLLI